MPLPCVVCSRPSTQASPASLCDYCWSEKYSMQNIGGTSVPYKQVLKEYLEGHGLWKSAEESLEEWGIRCKKAAMASKFGK
jgi:NMD protein affecting ribosome stability and mRNA decay